MKKRAISYIILLPLIVLLISVFCIYIYRMGGTEKEEIISSFNENYDLFNTVKEYSFETKGYLYVSYSLFNVTMKNAGHKDEIKIMNREVKRDINKLLRRVRYGGIYEYDDGIIFIRVCGNDEQGILYSENPDLDIYYELVEIEPNWYYYRMFHE